MQATFWSQTYGDEIFTLLFDVRLNIAKYAVRRLQLLSKISSSTFANRDRVSPTFPRKFVHCSVQESQDNRVANTPSLRISTYGDNSNSWKHKNLRVVMS